MFLVFYSYLIGQIHGDGIVYCLGGGGGEGGRYGEYKNRSFPSSKNPLLVQCYHWRLMLTAIYEMKLQNYSLFEKVNLLAGGEVLGKSVYPVKVTVMQGDLPISTDQCGEYWSCF